MSPRKRRIQDLIRAQIAIDQELDKLIRRQYRRPTRRTHTIARTGRHKSPHSPDVGWQEQARVNLLEMDRMHSRGIWHISHKK